MGVEYKYKNKLMLAGELYCLQFENEPLIKCIIIAYREENNLSILEYYDIDKKEIIEKKCSSYHLSLGIKQYIPLFYLCNLGLSVVLDNIQEADIYSTSMYLKIFDLDKDIQFLVESSLRGTSIKSVDKYIIELKKIRGETYNEYIKRSKDIKEQVLRVLRSPCYSEPLFDFLISK